MHLLKKEAANLSLESTKVKTRPNIHGSNEIKAILNDKEGPQNLRKLGRTVAAATTGDYLVNLDLWMIIPEVIDCLTTNASIEFFHLSRFLKWQMYVPLIIDDSPIWESGNQDFRVQITLLRLKDEFHCYFCLQVAGSLDTTGL